MKFQLGTTEMLDWQEVWCFRCKHDHDFSHTSNEEADGCSIIRLMILGDDVPELQPRDPNWSSQIPSPVSCSKFALCRACPADDPSLERRKGLTHREFVDQERETVLALPVVSEVAS